MRMVQKNLPLMMLTIILLICLPLFGMAEGADVLEVSVGNTPVKGQIVIDKTGMKMTGTTYLGEAIYENSYLKGAVFEIRAGEDIVGKDGKEWFKVGEVVATITTSGECADESPLLPLGKYEVQEITAPSGYVLDTTVYTVELKSTDRNTPVIAATVTSVNDPAEIMIRKNDQNGIALSGARFGLFNMDGIQIAASVSDDEGMVRFTLVPHGTYTIQETSAPDGYLLNRSSFSVTVNQNWTNGEEPVATVVNHAKQIKFMKVDTSGKPMPGITFKLINAETGLAVEKTVSDENGCFVFTKFNYGAWIVREAFAPEGYSKMPDYTFSVTDDWTEPAPIMLVNIPDHYEFIKTDTSGTPLAGVKFILEDADGNKLQELVSDKDGIVSITELKPGVYYIKETETLKGYTLSGDVRKLMIDQYYIVKDEMPKWINYTTIQTGVNLVVTGVMWIGIGLMVTSGTVGIIRKKRERSNK